jgi:hypothetical protein
MIVSVAHTNFVQRFYKSVKLYFFTLDLITTPGNVCTDLTHGTLSSSRRTQGIFQDHWQFNIFKRRHRWDEVKGLKDETAISVTAPLIHLRFGSTYSFERRKLAKTSSFVFGWIHVSQIANWPLVGLSIVPTMFNKDVFPPPDVPKMTTNSPRRNCNDTPLHLHERYCYCEENYLP